MDKVIVEESKKIAMGVLFLDVLLFLVMMALERMSLRMLWAVTFSSAFAILNFLMLGMACSRAVHKKPKSAKLSIRLSYVGRLALTGIVVYIGLVSPHLDPIGVIVPLIFPVISIYLISFIERRRECGRS